MAIAMRVNFTDVVRDGTLENVFVNGKIVGFQFQVRLSYYRGHFLSVIDELGVKIDGEEMPQEDIRFCLHGKEFGIAELHDLVSEFWPIIEPATIKVFKDGGLAPGEHDVDFHLLFHSPYMPISDTEYMPLDGDGAKTLVMGEY